MSATILLPAGERPAWLDYPPAFVRLVQQGLIDLTPWHIMTGEQALERACGLATRYPARSLFPFAFRQDTDDVACWTMGLGEQVMVIHDFASPGWEIEVEHNDTWSWFRSAVEDMIDWE